MLTTWKSYFRAFLPQRNRIWDLDFTGFKGTPLPPSLFVEFPCYLIIVPDRDCPVCAGFPRLGRATSLGRQAWYFDRNSHWPGAWAALKACSAFWQFPVILDVRNVIHLLSRNVSVIFLLVFFNILHSLQEQLRSLSFPLRWALHSILHPNCLPLICITKVWPFCDTANSHRLGAREPKQVQTTSSPATLFY